MSQKIWDKYEVALLIETYQNIKQERVGKNAALIMLSQSLRKMAHNEGLEIDEIFRNLNGMQWQLEFIERAFVDSDYNGRMPPKIFIEMVTIYKTNQQAFQEILAEAKRKVLGNAEEIKVDRKDLFKKWLSEHAIMTPILVVNNIEYVSRYASKRNIIKKSFWEFEDYREFNIIRVKLSGNKLFKVMHSKEHHQFEKNGKLYSTFLKDNQCSSKEQDTEECPAANIALGKEEEHKQTQSTQHTKQEQKNPNYDKEIFIKEKEAIAEFFNNDVDSVNTFLELYEYQKKTCPGILIDIRATIIGVKLEGERLRYYIDKHQRISFSKLKIGDKRYVKPFTDSLLPEFYVAVDETNKYFSAHPDDVKLYGAFKEEQEDKESMTDLQFECSKILGEKFSNGFKLGNILIRKRFFNFYEEMFGKPLTISEREFEKLLHQVGFNYENIIYPSTIIAADIKDQIISYIGKTLKENSKIIYYTALYDIFKAILNGYIYNYLMLKAYLKFVNNYEFFCGEEFISLNKDVKFDLKKEIIEAFINAGKPLTYDELYSKFPNIEKEQINAILRDKDFITNYKGSSCFYIGIFYSTDDDIAEIREFLHRRIEENGTTSGAELFNFIKNNLPTMIEANSEITELGFRNALRLQLEDEFDFRGDIISLDGQSVDKTDLVKNFCLERESFTFDELYEFISKINGQSYFEVVFSYAIRISENQYIRKDKIHFEIDKIDLALERYLESDYLPIEDVLYFTHFPTMDYPWNRYLLESFVYSYSREFTLFHKSFNQTIPTGAIVRKKSSIRTFEDLLIKVLQDNKVNGDIMTVEAAFDFLREHKYISVRRAKDIERIIIRAKREQ